MAFLRGLSSPIAGPHVLDNQNSMGRSGSEEMFVSPGLSSTSTTCFPCDLRQVSLRNYCSKC